jgi:hypothetical protein
MRVVRRREPRCRQQSSLAALAAFATDTKVIFAALRVTHMAVAAGVVGATPTTAGGVAFFFGKDGA